MMAKLRGGTFNPDGSRVQRLLQLTMDRATEIQDDEDSASPCRQMLPVLLPQMVRTEMFTKSLLSED